MWKSTPSRPEDTKPAVPSNLPTTPPAPPLRPVLDSARASEHSRSEVASIGKSVLIRGELSGSEDLYLDGEVEGNVTLLQHSLIIGPHGRVRANIHAKDVVIHGRVDGNVRGEEKVELRRTAVLTGDISTQRIVIEDGAFFKGAIDIQKENKTETKAEPKRETLNLMATATGAGTSSPPENRY
jgi:cytoskeletal protein CcmA (bactofilin family)